MGAIFYIVYRADYKELPAYLALNAGEVAAFLGVSRSLLFHAIKNKLTITTNDGERFTVARWNYKDLEGVTL
jgi:hypothetical protein